MILVRSGERIGADGQVLDGVSDADQALPRAMTFMIVVSPCTVVLATMPPLLSAMANAGRHGVLVRVALVGDGVNDAPALAAAHTGIAMGKAGSDLTLDTAAGAARRSVPARLSDPAGTS